MFYKKMFSVILLLLFTSTAFSQSFTLESVDGLLLSGELPVNSSVTFNIRMTGDETSHGGMTNGFRIYSPDGAEWTTTIPDTVYVGFGSLFDLVYAINTFSIDGLNADTVGFGGAVLFGPGLPANFNEVAYSITIGPIPPSSGGRTIVLDSSFYPPTGVWKWGGPDAFPSWDGPHSYTVEGGDPPAYMLSADPDSFFYSQLINDDTTFQTGSFVVTQTTNDESINFTATSLTSWLTILSADGATPGSVSFRTSKPGDTAGIYIGYIEVNSPQAVNSPQTVQVVVELVDPPKYLVIDPQELNFSAIEGHADPAPQIVNVTEMNNFNIDFEAHNDIPWISLPDSVGTTPDDVTVAVNIDGLLPGTYFDTVVFNYDEDPQDGTVFLTHVFLEIFPNNAPAITPITDYSIDECESITAVFSAMDIDEDAISLWVDPLINNMSFVDNGDGTGSFTFFPDLTQAGSYSMTLYATDNVDTTTATFTIDVAECEIQLETHAVIVPSTLFAAFKYAIVPMTGTIYFGDFTDGHSSNDVELTSISVNNSLTPLSAVVESGYSGFIGEVVKLEFDMNDFLDIYLPFFDTTIEVYTIEGNFTDQNSFAVNAEVTLRGHLSGDFNQSGAVDVLDLILMVDYFFNQGDPPVVMESIDMNNDGKVDIVDLQQLVLYIFY